MDNQPSREALMQRVARLEAQLQNRRKQSPADECLDTFGPADMMQAADGICVCHAIHEFPFVRFTFWNRQMVRLTGYDMETINRKGWYQSVYPDPDIQARAIERMAQMREGVNIEAENWEVTRADGDTRTLRISTSVLDQGDGTPRVMAIMHDVTELKRFEATLRSDKQHLKRQVMRQSKLLADVQRALKISDARYHALFNIAGDALFVENDRDEILDVNQQACDLLGYSRDELLSMKVCDIQAPEYRDEAGCVLLNELANHQGKPFETVDLHKDGTRIPVEVTNNRLDEAGLFLSIVRDITERKRVEAEILYEKHFSDTVISHLPGSFYMFAEDGRMKRWNANLPTITGYSSEEIMQMNALDFFPEDERGRVHGRIQEVFEKGHSQVTANFLTKDGRTIPHVLTGVKMEYAGTTYLAGLGLDMTEEIKVKNALIESEARFRQIAENIKEVFWLFDWRDQQVLYVSPAYETIWGRPRETLYKRYDAWGESIHPEDRDHAQSTFNRILESGGGELREYRIVRPDGTERWVSDTGYAITDENGSVVRIAGIAEDITERKHTQEALTSERERLAVTLRSIGDAVITTDREGRIALMNPIAEDLTGWTEAEALGNELMEVFRIVDERSGVPCANPVDKVLSSGQIVALANHTVLVAKDGQKSVIADSGAPILNGQHEIIGVVLVFRDITGQQHIEKELLKMEKLKSLGVLAGGIAHDFNNFLTGIIGNLSLAKLDIQPGHPLGRPLDEMEKAALRAKALTQQLLTFSKGGEPVKHTTRIDDLVRECAQFALHGSNVRCDLDIDSDLHPADVDEGQIAQVLNNLMINADQAMPEGGIISIQATNVCLSPNNPFALDAGNYIRLMVQDQGPGMQPAHLKKVFDPYFTTKQKGSGLGLAVAYSIIAKHDGQLSVESELGQGTTFTILLPSSKATQLSGTKTTKGLVAGHGRVLVMDDEDFIRELASVMLEKMGYEVALAQDGQSAVEIYKGAQDAGKPFDVVILDLTVPGGMGGQETLRHLMDLDPDVRAIVSSGYSNDPVMANYATHGFKGAVKKPYLVQEMSRVLHDVING